MPYDSLYLDWHKLNHELDCRISEFGLFVHTFNTLLPPEKYYAQHPEYYAMVKGRRVATQPCLSNPQVLEIVCDELSRRIAANPEAKYWSVSANDNYGYCTCPECAKIDAEEESPAGSVVRFANKVAARFPRQNDLDAGLPLLAQSSQNQTRPERQHHVLQHRVRPSHAYRRRSGQRRLPTRHGGLGRADRQHFRMGLLRQLQGVANADTGLRRDAVQHPIFRPKRRQDFLRAVLRPDGQRRLPPTARLKPSTALAIGRKSWIISAQSSASPTGYSGI